MGNRIGWVFLISGLGLGLLIAACGGDSTSSPATQGSVSAEAAAQVALPNKITAPRFVDSFPGHGETLAQAPPVTVLNFNFNLHPNSGIRITANGNEVPLGDIVISDNELSMTTVLQGGDDGVYQVDYSACWPDGSCHEGTTGFLVDSGVLSNYVDLSGQQDVAISMFGGNSFDPARMVIDSGTTVIWTNNDQVPHFVNTDPHPSHNVLEALNSVALNPGDTYSYTFDEAGNWGYHCSAHFNLGMVAQVIVK